jgi:shikimate dehydrogenase
MKRACVMGWPASHSLSPVIHGYWLKEHGLDGEYIKQPVDPGEFESFLKALPQRGFCGGNVTVPYKIRAYGLCELKDSAASAIGAVNTVWFENGKLAGSNTDAEGFNTNLDSEAPGWDRDGPAVVIGAGGAARAIVWALAARGFTKVSIINRTAGRAEKLASAFSCANAAGFESLEGALKDAALVVNCSTLGMTGAPPLEIGLSGVRRTATVCDIVYHPLETALLRQARERGLGAVDGLGMLLHQAVPGFEKWFGGRPKVTPELRQAVLSAIAARESGQG